MNDLPPPPASIQAEQSVIGGLFLQPDTFDSVTSILQPESFYSGQHRLIYATIARMVGEGLPVDVLTVADKLKESGRLDEAGGQSYLGSLALNTPSAANIKRYAEIVQARAMERQVLAALAGATDLMNTPGDALEKIGQAQAMVAGVELQTRCGGLVPASEGLIPVLENLRQRIESGVMPGLPTGFVDLDQRTGGFRKGDLIIVAGRPSMGKSALAFQIAQHVATSGQVAAFFSLEMTTGQLLERALSGLARVEHDLIRDGKIGAEESVRLRDATRVLDNAELHIDDTPSIRVAEIGARLRTLKRKRGVALAVVDYLSLVPGEGENRNQEIGSITRGLKALAKTLNIPIILVAQLSRKCEERTDKRPLLSDLRDSGEPEQDADIVMMVYRDDYYHAASTAAGTAEIIIRKFRGGATGTTRLSFLPKIVRFENYAGPPIESTPRPVSRRQFYDN